MQPGAVLERRFRAALLLIDEKMGLRLGHFFHQGRKPTLEHSQEVADRGAIFELQLEISLADCAPEGFSQTHVDAHISSRTARVYRSRAWLSPRTFEWNAAPSASPPR